MLYGYKTRCGGSAGTTLHRSVTSRIRFSWDTNAIVSKAFAKQKIRGRHSRSVTPQVAAVQGQDDVFALDASDRC